MPRHPERFLKYARVLRCFARGAVIQSPVFLRLIPTDRCNLDCRYCFQHSNSPRVMSRSEFDTYLAHGLRLGTGFISFLGGEPLTWPHLEHAITQCTRAHILTDVTTNGSLLTPERLRALGAAGLDYLNLSVDTDECDSVSRKNSIFQPGFQEMLDLAREEYGTRVRVNTVLHRNNLPAVKRIIEKCHEHRVMLSIGYVVPEGESDAAGFDFLFSESDTEFLREWIAYIRAKKQQGYRIIDPDEYFTGILQFLRGESFWLCNYPRRFGWVNIMPSGRIRSCTKHMDELDVRFLDLTARGLADLRRSLLQSVHACNPKCYSNCAFDGAYYRTHPLRLLWRFIARMGARPEPQ